MISTKTRSRNRDQNSNHNLSFLPALGSGPRGLQAACVRSHGCTGCSLWLMGTCPNPCLRVPSSHCLFVSSLAAFIPLLSATRTAASKTLHRLNSVRVIPATPQWPVWYFKLGKITTAIQDHFKINCESGPEVHFVTTLLNSYALLFAEVGLTGAVRKTWYTWHICTCVCRVCKHCRTDLEIAKLRWTILRYL